MSFTITGKKLFNMLQLFNFFFPLFFFNLLYVFSVKKIIFGLSNGLSKAFGFSRLPNLWGF